MGYLSRQVYNQYKIETDINKAYYDTFKANFKLIESPKGKKFQRQKKKVGLHGEDQLFLL